MKKWTNTHNLFYLYTQKNWTLGSTGSHGDSKIYIDKRGQRKLMWNIKILHTRMVEKLILNNTRVKESVKHAGVEVKEQLE